MSEQLRRRRALMREPLAAVLAVACAVTTLWIAATAIGWNDDALADSVPSSPWIAAVAIVGLLVADTVVPVPGTMLLLASGALFGPIVGPFVNAVGLVASAGVGYWVGRTIAARTGPPARSLSGWMVAVSRGVPLLSESIAIAAGVLRFPPGRFVRSATVGSVSVGTVYGVVGSVAGDHWSVLPAALAVALAAYLSVRRLDRA